MPAEQKGSVYKTKTGYGVRWLEGQRRRHQSGFASKTAARNHFRDEIAPRLAARSTVDPAITLREFVALYLTAHGENVQASTLRVLTERLRSPVARFGDVELRKLERQAPEIAAWRATLKEGVRRDNTQALRQCLDAAVRWGVILRNPAKLAGPNPAPKRKEIVPFTRDELDRICAELGPHAPIVRFAAATGLRPSEWIALERRDIKRDEGVLVVERSYSRGVLRPFGKTVNSRRRVPLSSAALAALDAMPRRIDTPLVFPGADGLLLNLQRWRADEWAPALTAAGVRGTIYTLRHVFASNALAAGIGVFDVARFMGTSLQQLNATYGHLVVGAEDAARAKLDAAATGSGV